MSVELGVGHPLFIYMIWTEKYSHISGTHCWFCDREYATSKCLTAYKGFQLRRTREHIVPKSKMIYNIRHNYIGSCIDCNGLKKNMTADQFAEYIAWLMKTGGHEMWFLLPMMKKRAWKLYNKTSYLHRNYKTIRLQLVQTHKPYK
jgi:hypothetical protein